MDVLKFAFETVIVGLLALPWLVLLASIFLPPITFNKPQNNTVLSTFLQPALLMVVGFRPDATIRRIPRKCLTVADNLFLPQEEAVLKFGTDKSERVSRLHEQVIVLRGAVFNGLVFVVLCWFSYCSRPRGEVLNTIWSSPAWIAKTLMAVGLVGFLVYVATYLGHATRLLYDVTDPPIMARVLLFLGLVGVFAVLRGTTKHAHIPTALGFGLLFTALAYGAWSWTEVLYDQSVIGAYFTR